MRLINGKVPVLIPPEFTHDQIRAMGAAVDCILKHDPITGLPSLVPAEQCIRPPEDMPRVVSIVGIQRKEKPESFLSRFKNWTSPDHDPDGPRAA